MSTTCLTTTKVQYIRPRELSQRYGISRITAWRWSMDEKMAFPRAIRLSANVSVYDASEVDMWFAARKNARLDD